MFPKVEFDFSKRENILCETVLDQGVVEGVGEGLDTKFEGPEFGRGFESFHFFGHKRLVAIVPWIRKKEVNEACVRKKKDKGKLNAAHHYFHVHKEETKMRIPILSFPGHPFFLPPS